MELLNVQILLGHQVFACSLDILEQTLQTLQELRYKETQVDNNHLNRMDAYTKSTVNTYNITNSQVAPSSALLTLTVQEPQ